MTLEELRQLAADVVEAESHREDVDERYMLGCRDALNHPPVDFAELQDAWARLDRADARLSRVSPADLIAAIDAATEGA